MSFFRISVLLGLAWPLVQLIPLPDPLLRWLAPERAAELARFAAAGVTVPPTLSLYPYATWRLVAVLAVCGALYLTARRFRERANWLLALIVIAGLAEAMIGLRQHLLPLAEPRGTFSNRNVLAAWLVGCYGAALALPRAWPAAVVLAAAVVLTMSRAGIAGLLVATIVFGVARRRAAAAAVCGIVLLAAALGAIDRFHPAVLQQERVGRVAMWWDSLRALGRYGRAGAGAGAFSYAFRRSHPYLGAYTIDHPHSDYLEILVEWGLPAGLFLIGGLAGGLVARLRRPGCLSGVAGIAAHALVDFPLHVPAVAGLVAVLAGLSDPGPRRRRAWLFPVAALLLAAPQLGRPNAEALYQAGAYHQALSANPYAAPLWMELAWQAESRGSTEAALRYAALALQVEPHTHRTTWRAANLFLRVGHAGPGAQLLDQLARAAPELRPAIALARRQTP